MCGAQAAPVLALSFADANVFVTGTNPYSVTVGDFNADGNLDLAVANMTNNNISVLLGNCDGTFQPRAD